MADGARSGRFLTRILSVTAGLLLGAGALEAGVRIIMPQYSPANEIRFVFDKTRNVFSGPRSREMRQTKNTGDYDVSVRFNSAGFRDSKEIEDVKFEDWIVVGDSFSFGWGVDESRRFGDLLDRAIGAQVFNLAAPGNIRHYEMLLNYADSQGADTSRVVIGLCVENDVIDYDAERADMMRVIDAPPLVNLKRVLGNASAAWRAFTAVVHSTRWARDGATSLGAIAPGGLPELTPQSLAQVESTVEQLKRLATGRQLVVLIIPSRQVYVDDTRAGARATHQSLVKALKAADINVVDPLIEFDRSADPLHDFHFRHDGHWNKHGHRVAAGVLVNAIENHLAMHVTTER